MISISELTRLNKEGRFGVLSNKLGVVSTEDIFKLKEDTQVFKLHNVDYLPEVKDIESYEQYIKLPFPVCIFIFKHSLDKNNDNIAICTQNDAEISIQIFNRTDGAIEERGDIENNKTLDKVVEFSGSFKMTIRETKEFYERLKLTPDYDHLELEERLLTLNIDDTKFDFSVLDKEIENVKRMLKEHWDKLTEKDRDRLQHYIDNNREIYKEIFQRRSVLNLLRTITFIPILESFLVFLATKPTLDLVKHPEPLQKKFSKKYGVKVVDHYVVDLKKHYEDHNSTGYRGAGVRFHWRRGHFRKLPNKITWVRHCSVGNKELGVVEKEYSL